MPEITEAQVRELLELSKKATPGHQETHISESIILGCMKQEAREDMEKALEEWSKHVKDRKENSLPPEDPVYSFAYWLFRWSGIVIPGARNLLPALAESWFEMAGELERLRKVQQWNDGPPPLIFPGKMFGLLPRFHSRFLENASGYKTFKWLDGGGWRDKEVARAKRWMPLPTPPKGGRP